MPKTYAFCIDPGHGWLRVPRQEIKDAGIAVTAYSYWDGQYGYLEEDIDAGRFIDAAGITSDQIVYEYDCEWVRDLLSPQPAWSK